ncbi:MAG TPA: lyase family protein, partial [Longimicrobiales bacterium]|nr:lyase family protein [Longimicrobiales bacterium]
MTLWSGRFGSEPDRLLWDYTVSYADHRLLEDDVEGSLAHVGMLRDVGLLSDAEHDSIHEGLQRILADARDGTFEFLDTDEDVHTAVERRLVELIGEVGGKLHTGRSRNDQIALDMRLYLRRGSAQRAGQLAGFGLVLAELAERH